MRHAPAPTSFKPLELYQSQLKWLLDEPTESLDGIALHAATGVATALKFEATSDGQAAITRDYAMRPSEVERVLRALRSSGIEITALHSHMLLDAPHHLYVHLWAHGDPATLARGLRSALD